MDVRNINQVFVGANCARTANVQIHDPSNTTTYLGLGEIVVVNEQGIVLTNAATKAANERIFIVGRSIDGKSVYRSAPLTAKGILDLRIKNYGAGAEQITYLGYNGATGALSATLVASTLYSIRLHNSYQNNIDREITKSFSYKSGLSTPTQADIVSGIVGNFAFSNNPNLDFSAKMEALTDSTPTASTSGNITVTNGSRFISAVTDIDNGGMVAGDFILLSGVAYKVESINTTLNTAVLAYPYQGASGILTDANCSFITAANAAAGNWGIKMTGVALYFEVGKWDYRKEMFTVTTCEYISSLPVTSTNASKGCGTYEEVAEMEWFNKPFFGNSVKTHPNYPVSYPLDANSTLTYDTITLNWINEETQNIEGSTLQRGSVTICLPVGAGQADGGTTTIEEVLNNYVVTELGIGTVIAVS